MTQGRPKNPLKKSVTGWAIKDFEGENSKFLQHEMNLLSYAQANYSDFTDYDTIAQGCQFYLEECSKADIKPNVVGLACTLGVNRDTLIKHMTGDLRTDPNAKDLLNQMYSIMELQLNLAIQSGGSNPLGNIFLLKNHHNYSDKNELLVEGKQPTVIEQSDAELKSKYLENTIDISDDEE